ncbi:MAG: PAS domain-containing protein, partial [Phycisphaerales bacterium]|nr:PAS domain-containing protein [Phycisphaerales bacterium]
MSASEHVADRKSHVGGRTWSAWLVMSSLLVIVLVVWTLFLSARVDALRLRQVEDAETLSRLDRFDAALQDLRRELGHGIESGVIDRRQLAEHIAAVRLQLASGAPPLEPPEPTAALLSALSVEFAEDETRPDDLASARLHRAAIERTDTRVQQAAERMRQHQRDVSAELDAHWQSIRLLLVGSWIVGSTLVVLAWLYRREAARRHEAEIVSQELAGELAVRVEERTAGLRDALRKLRGEMLDRQRAESALRESERFLEQAQEVASIGSWVSHPGDEGTLVWSKGVFRIFAMDPDRFDGRVQTFFDMVHPDDRQAVREADEVAKRDGTPYSVDHRILRSDGEIRWVHERGEVMRDETGRVVRMIGTVQDITQRKRAEERQTNLLRELDHRVNNNLALVLSISERTAAGAATVAAFQEAFSKRIHAIARTHEALARRKWGAIELRELVLLALAAPDGGTEPPFVLTGPRTAVPPHAALPLAHALNELATNALKYGALTTTGGRIEVQWSVDAERTCHLEWTEKGGPPVVAPTRHGLGLQLLESAIQHEL